MGSTDSSGTTGSGGQSCGLVSSLFPSSCRGRAEAFARRLHHRLTSLGGDDEERKLGAEPTPSETSWLHSSGPVAVHQHQVLERQPKHNSDSDLYFDFDIEEEDDEVPGSPAEDVNVTELAGLILNPECHCPLASVIPIGNHVQGPESGCVFSSPVSGTSPESDSSDVYYDPESSETDKMNESFYDVETSESDPSSLSNGLLARVLAHRHGSPRPEKSPKPGRKNSPVDPEPDETTSESSSERSNGIVAISSSPNIRPVSRVAGSEDSLDTTSPSHESLWSTFDDSTLSLQDESPARSPRVISTPNCTEYSNVHKSHSDSEIPATSNGSLDEIALENEERNRSKEQLKNTIEEGQNDNETEHSTYSSILNIPGALTLECPTGARILPEDKLEKNEVQLEIREGGGILNGDTDKMVELLKRLSGDLSVNEDEDEEVEEVEVRPQRVRRCSSLKTGKTPPGTPGRKKIVRFADVLGLDLADVRTFLDEIPRVPNSAYSDLVYDDAVLKDGTTAQLWRSKYSDSQLPSNSASTKPMKLLVALFQQPGGTPDFLDKVRERQVCLENVIVQDPVNLCLCGTVRVRNLDFHKSVHIRYSLNGWRSFSDLQATYVTNSCDGFSDKFIFTLYCHTLTVGQRIEFAVRYQCKGAQYWDNNAGANYCFQCLPAVPSLPYIPITASDTVPRNWGEPAFY